MTAFLSFLYQSFVQFFSSDFFTTYFYLLFAFCLLNVIIKVVWYIVRFNQ